MSDLLRVWGEAKTGRDGKLYGVRYLLTADEANGLQAAGLVGDLDELIGMQEAADRTVAMFEREQHLANGGGIQ